MTDLTTLGAAYRADADKALHRALFFAVVLVLAHLLDIRSSEADAFGFKLSLKDPIVVYGAISLVFGYYLSRFLSLSDLGDALFPLRVGPRRMRANLRMALNAHRIDKNKRKNPLPPLKLKSSARNYIMFGNVILLPYRILATMFTLAAIVFMFRDLYGLGSLIWETSPVISAIVSDF